MSRVNTVLLGVSIALLVVTIVIVTTFYAVNKQNDNKSTKRSKDTLLSNIFADVSTRVEEKQENMLVPLLTATKQESVSTTAKDELVPYVLGVVLEISPVKNELAGGMHDWLKSNSPILPTKQSYYDTIVASKSLEFQPNLVNYLKNIYDLLQPGGKYCVVLPDCRYDATHHMTPSSLAQVLKARFDSRTTVLPETLFEHAALQTHNDAARHWRGDHDLPSFDRIQEAQKYLNSQYAVLPTSSRVQAWVFTPHTFQQIVNALHATGHSGLELKKLFVTLKNKNEFCAVLTKSKT